MTHDLTRYRQPLLSGDDIALLDRIYLLADALDLADKIDAEIWRVMDIERADALECAQTPQGAAYPVDLADHARRIRAFADLWMAELEKDTTDAE